MLSIIMITLNNNTYYIIQCGQPSQSVLVTSIRTISKCGSQISYPNSVGLKMKDLSLWAVSSEDGRPRPHRTYRSKRSRTCRRVGPTEKVERYRLGIFRNGRTASVQRFSLEEHGARPWEIWTFKGRVDVNTSNGSEIWVPQIGTLQLGISESWPAAPRRSSLYAAASIILSYLILLLLVLLLYYVMWYYMIWYYAIRSLYDIILYHYVMLCYVMLCHVMLYYII